MDERKIAYCVLIILMILGVGAMGLMQILLEERDNEYTHPHSYLVTGDYETEFIEGTGNSVYINESENEYLYQFITVISNLDIPKFNVICDSSKKPIYLYDYLGDVVMDMVDCSEYRYVSDSFTFTFDIDEKMIVHYYTIGSDDYCLKAKLVN